MYDALVALKFAKVKWMPGKDDKGRYIELPPSMRLEVVRVEEDKRFGDFMAN